MSREQFEKELDAYQSKHVTGSSGLVRKIASHFYESRQPEIDALKAENTRLSDNLEAIDLDTKALVDEIDALKAEVAHLNGRLVDEILLRQEKEAEVERLRKDSERLEWLEAHPRIGEIHVDGEVKDCYLYAVSGALGVPLRTIIDTIKETK